MTSRWKSTLVIGTKGGNAYFARDLARPQIFRIDGDLYKKLGESYSDLRDKKVAHFDQQQIVRAELRDANGMVALTQKQGAAEEWTIRFTCRSKRQSRHGLEDSYTFDGLSADEVLDHPPANIVAMLAKPRWK